jgi:hypothetical protein
VPEGWTGPEDNRRRRGELRKRSWREQSRDQVLKSWYGDECGELEAEIHQRGPSLLGAELGEFERLIARVAASPLTRLQENWPTIVGEQVARYSFPAFLDRGELRIEVNSAPQKYVYEVQLKPQILAKVAAFDPGIRFLRFVIGEPRR